MEYCPGGMLVVDATSFGRRYRRKSFYWRDPNLVYMCISLVAYTESDMIVDTIHLTARSLKGPFTCSLHTASVASKRPLFSIPTAISMTIYT